MFDSNNKIEKGTFYSSLLFVGLLFLVFGFSVGYFVLGSPTSPSTEMNQQPEVSENDISNDQQSQQQPPEVRRKAPYLSGEVKKVTEEEEENRLVLEVELDLTKTFSRPGKDQAVRKFLVEKGKSSVYQLSEEELVNPSELESKEEVAFEQISKGDKVALRCSLPPASFQEFFKFKKFTVSAVVIME